MVISSEGVERPIEPPVVRTSQWLNAEASSHRGTSSWRVGDVEASPVLHGDADAAEVKVTHLSKVQQ
jgi:hypothetical protein